MRRMLRSPHWTADAAERSAVTMLVVPFGLAVSSHWVLAIVAVPLVPGVLVAWLAVFLRAERRGKVVEAEERAAENRRWWREASPAKWWAAVILLVLVLGAVFCLEYLYWRWDL